MSDQFDALIHDQFDDRSFANAINRTYSRENLFNVLKYGNGSSMRGTYLELTEISIAEKKGIHILWTVIILKVVFNMSMELPWWKVFCWVLFLNSWKAKNVRGLSYNRLWFYFSANGDNICIGLLHGQGLFFLTLSTFKLYLSDIVKN